MKVPYVSVTVLLAIAAGLAAGCSESKNAETEPILRPVRTMEVFATGGGRQRAFSGMAKSRVESRLSFKVGGTIQRVAVRVGESVKRGQLIAELDPEDYRLQLQDTEASLAQAQAQERKAKLDYSRTEDLYENRNASKQDLDAARATQESAELAVESLTNRLELAKRQLAYTRLTAPVAGSIASRSVEPNENVSPGQEVVLLTSESDIEIQVAVPGVIISQIREGDTVSVNFDALPDRRLPGTVTEVGVASTGGATTFPVTVKVDEANEQVRSGMSAEVTFTFGEEGETERYVVPSIAVLEDRDGRFVYVVEASDQPGVGIVKRTPVTIGELVGDGLEIRRGLNDGDDVVIAGVSKIIDGQRVKFGAED